MDERVSLAAGAAQAKGPAREEERRRGHSSNEMTEAQGRGHCQHHHQETNKIGK